MAISAASSDSNHTLPPELRECEDGGKPGRILGVVEIELKRIRNMAAQADDALLICVIYRDYGGQEGEGLVFVLNPQDLRHDIEYFFAKIRVSQREENPGLGDAPLQAKAKKSLARSAGASGAESKVSTSRAASFIMSSADARSRARISATSCAPRSRRSRRGRSSIRSRPPNCRSPRTSTTSPSRTRQSTRPSFATLPAAASSPSSATPCSSAEPAPARRTR